MIIGLTGGIGSGKSAAAGLFKDIGVDLIDADDLARDALNRNSKGYKLFIEQFGDKYLDEYKNINRELIRKLIFNDSAAKSKLENIIHPIVRSGIEAFIKNTKSDYCIIVVPLIFETNSLKLYDSKHGRIEQDRKLGERQVRPPEQGETDLDSSPQREPFAFRDTNCTQGPDLEDGKL